MVFGRGKRAQEELEQQLNAEVEFWKNELSKVCNEKSYYVARALAAERSLAEAEKQMHQVSLQQQAPSKDGQAATRDAGQDAVSLRTRDQSHDGHAQPGTQTMQQQQPGARGRYLKPSGSNNVGAPCCPPAAASQPAANPTESATEAAGQPAAPVTPVVHAGQQTEAGYGVPSEAAVAELEAKLATSAADLANAQGDLAAAAGKLAAMEQEIGRLKAALVEQSKKADEAADTTAQLRRLSSALEAEQSKLKARAAEAAELRHELSVVKGLSDDTANQAATLLHSLGEAQAHNTKLAAELASKESLVALLTQQLADLQGPADSLTTSTPPRTPQPSRLCPTLDETAAPHQQFSESELSAGVHRPSLHEQHGSPCASVATAHFQGSHGRQRASVDQPATTLALELVEADEPSYEEVESAGGAAATVAVQGGDLYSGGASPGLSSDSTATAQYGETSLQLSGSQGGEADSGSCLEASPVSSDVSSGSQEVQVEQCSGLLTCSPKLAQDHLHHHPQRQQQPCQQQTQSLSGAPCTPGHATPSRHVRTPASKTPRHCFATAAAAQQHQELLDERALEARKRRLSKTPPVERKLSAGVNWGCGGSVEAFGEGGTTVMSIVRRFQ